MFPVWAYRFRSICVPPGLMARQRVMDGATCVDLRPASSRGFIGSWYRRGTRTKYRRIYYIADRRRK